MSVYRHRRGGWYLSVYLPTGKRDQIYLGNISQDQARFVDRMVSDFASAFRVGAEPSREAVAWSGRIDPKLAARLASSGLITRPSAITMPIMDDWARDYIESRTDFRPSTVKGWTTAKKHLISAFGGRKIDQITVADAKQFARDLAQRYSSEHASKLVERANQLFLAAIDAKILIENPFFGVRVRAVRSKERSFYLEGTTSRLVLEACPHQHARTLFALARWCGLRVPHEPLAIRWSDIDWTAGRLAVPNGTKTGPRVLPLFSVAFAELKKLRESAPLDSEYVFDRARSSAATTWRDWLLSAVQNAGLHGWPKLWHNLRASCRTDLEDQFPSHVCDAWIGHSTRVAKDHYLQVTPEHWEEAKRTARV